MPYADHRLLVALFNPANQHLPKQRLNKDLCQGDFEQKRVGVCLARAAHPALLIQVKQVPCAL